MDAGDLRLRIHHRRAGSVLHVQARDHRPDLAAKWLCQSLSPFGDGAPSGNNGMAFQAFSKRKLGRRDATDFKKLPHLDDLLLWQIAMSVPECGRMPIELHTELDCQAYCPPLPRCPPGDGQLS